MSTCTSASTCWFRTTRKLLSQRMTDIAEPSSRSSVPPQLLDHTDVSFQLFRATADLPEAWDQLADASGDWFLSRDYLDFVERYPLRHMQPGYLLFQKGEQAIGIAILQFVEFRAAENIRSSKQSGLMARIRDWIARRLNFHIVVCGTLQLSGQHAFYFADQANNESGRTWLIQALNMIEQKKALQIKPVRGTMIKDIYASDTPSDVVFTQNSYHRLSFQPTCLMDLDPAWETFDDYKAALSSKYRVRVKRAFKKAADLEHRPLTYEDLVQHRDTLNDFYLRLAETADFNMVWLHPDYLIEFKREFPERYHCFGYFRGDELVGYYSTIDNGPEMEAHFLGFLPELNTPKQLYLNMLLGILSKGIADRKKRIVFARTATTIKTSIGAHIEPLHLYLHVKYPLFNAVAKPMVDYMEPPADYEVRHPFKTAG